MTICPSCDFENIEGTDVCEQCQQPLTDEYMHDPDTAVERGLLNDHLDMLSPNSPVTVAPDMPTRDVIRLMVDSNIGCVLVTEDEKMVGIFSERDALLKLNTEAAELGDRPVSEFMTTNVDTLDSHAKIAFAVHRMDLGSYRHVPITGEDGKPTGIISVRDILRYITERSTETA